jgi:hypothetical protein
MKIVHHLGWASLLAFTSIAAVGCDPGEGEGAFCGGIAGIACPAGQTCIDDPSDDCDPEHGGADCGGICVEETNPCAAVLCPVNTECVVKGGQAQCVTRCGDATCGEGMVCCNPLLGICTAPGRVCAF